MAENSKFDETVEQLRKIIRAKNGQSIDEDTFQGLLNVKDLRERTKLNAHNVYRHAYMRLLSLDGGDEWALMKEWAIQEEKLFISQDGERATNFINSLGAKKKEETQGQSMTVQIPTQNPPTPEKKGRFHF